jgi:hypothetical protein
MTTPFTKPTSFRLPPVIREALAKLPRNERSEFVRTALVVALDGGYLLPPEATEEMRKLREEVRRVGLNLNQLVRTLHLARSGEASPPTAAEVRAVHVELVDVAKALGAMMTRWRER